MSRIEKVMITTRLNLLDVVSTAPGRLGVVTCLEAIKDR